MSKIKELPITQELVQICCKIQRGIAKEGENYLIYSDDEYQTDHYCGGWTPGGDKGSGFYFSYYTPGGDDFIFYLSLEVAFSIANGDMPKIQMEYWKRSPIGPY